MSFGLMRPLGLLVIVVLMLLPRSGAAQIPCDFNGNGKCNLEDIHELADAIALGQTSADINEDGNANSEDMEFYLTNALNRLNGDFDLIGGVDFSDFLRLSNNFGQAGQWSDGDANADGVIQFPDFLILSSNFGQRQPSLQPSVNVEVTELDGLYTYEYTIENADSSPTGINVLFLDVVDEQGVVEGSLLGFGQYEIDAPNGWTGEYFENSSPIEEVTFIEADGRNCGTPGVVPGSVETFSIQSEFGPGERSLIAGHLVPSCDHFFATAQLRVLAPSVLPGSGEAASVPEPATPLVWLLLCLLSLSRRRQRRAQ